MVSLSLREFVATTTRKTPLRSAGSKWRSSSSIFPARAHSRTVGVASRDTTRMRAPVSSRAPILGSPTLPAPTRRTFLPSSFRNMGNKLVTDTSCNVREILLRQVTSNSGHELTRQEFTQFGVAVTSEVTPQVLVRLTVSEIAAE